MPCTGTITRISQRQVSGAVYVGIGVCRYANEITLDIGESLGGRVLMIVVRAELRMVVWVGTLNMELS